MKVKIEKDEWYPVFIVVQPNDYGKEVDISDETLAEHKRVTLEFNAIQNKLRAIYEQHEEPTWAPPRAKPLPHFAKEQTHE